jgi:hypothetical protein
VAIAVRLRAETAMTVQWIAARLPMGAPGYVNHFLFRQRKAKGERVANIKTRSQSLWRLVQGKEIVWR